MLELALKAGLPFIGVQTDDLVHVTETLHVLTGHKPFDMKATFPQDAVLVTYDSKYATAATYSQVEDKNSTLVFVNCEPSTLIFDAGTLHLPPSMLRHYLQTQNIDPDDLEPILKGLSLKAVKETLLLTEARYGDVHPIHVRAMRSLMGESIQGLYPQDTTYEFYQYPPELEAWLSENKEYFLHSERSRLIPRGILLQGPPGTGKTMAAKAIANYLNVPLYRLDIGTTMDKYTGVSEHRLQRILQQVEKEAPCVMMVDEIEKAFAETEDSGVTSRLLGQLLWWLSEHRSRVMTVMTANSLTIPPELFRAGRIDLVLTIEKLKLFEAKVFALRVLQSIAGKQNVSGSWTLVVNKELENGPKEWAHSEVAELVYRLIKRNKWLF